MAQRCWILSVAFVAMAWTSGCERRPEETSVAPAGRSPVEERLSKSVVKDLQIDAKDFEHGYFALIKACEEQGCAYAYVSLRDIPDSDMDQPVQLSGTMTVLEAFESLAKQLDAKLDGSAGHLVIHRGSYSSTPPITGPDPFAPHEPETPTHK